LKIIDFFLTSCSSLKEINLQSLSPQLCNYWVLNVETGQVSEIDCVPQTGMLAKVVAVGPKYAPQYLLFKATLLEEQTELDPVKRNDLMNEQHTNC
jgi:hypothetical protein